MKKLFSIMLAASMALTVAAQTDFRRISFAEAQKAAQQEKKLIFVDFYTSWCGPCKQMANNVFPQKQVGDFMNERFVCVKYDAEKEELDLVKRSNITAYPTFVIFNADGSELNRKVGGASADAFIADIDRLSNTELTPEKILARYESGERSAQLVKAYASMLKEEAYNSRKGRQEKLDKANSIINEYYNTLNDKQKLSADNFFIYKDWCNTTADEKMQYLFANRNKAAKDAKSDIEDILATSYNSDLQNYTAFYYPINKEGYEKFRQQAKELGIFSQPKFEGCMEVLDAYFSGDINKYVKVVETNSLTKCKENRFTIFYGMPNAMKSADNETKKAAAMIIRKQLIDMPGNDISFVGTIISDLEGTSNRH